MLLKYLEETPVTASVAAIEAATETAAEAFATTAIIKVDGGRE